MAARYQHLSPAFLSDAVKLLDTSFAESSQTLEAPENGQVFRFYRPHRVPEGKRAAQRIMISAFDCWRPRRDLNPCYRRERITPSRK